MIYKKLIPKIYYGFLFLHLFLWTLIPTLVNTNLPLDTIEALAWGSDLDWGFNKHPPFSAFAVELFYLIFGSNDWAYYFLSQVFVIIAFVYVWKFSSEIFQDKIYALISLLILEAVYFYNYTTPEFNVNVSQLPFWALTVFYFWKSLNNQKIEYWLLFGIFSALGFLSKYLFIFLLISIFLFFCISFKNYKKFLNFYLFSVIISLIILLPHFFWLLKNDFVTINYGIGRSNISTDSFANHFLNPLEFTLKQFIILIPFFIMILTLIKKVKLNFNLRNNKNLFLFSVTILPLILMLLTSLLTGAKIRTMWLTPFYLFFGTLFITIIKNVIDLKKIKRFFVAFLFFFIIYPSTYLAVSIVDETKRTDYPGKEISRLVQNKWDDNFINEIKIVVGDEWFAGNLSYHLTSRPIWINDLKKRALSVNDDQGVIYTGNPKILKKICPGVFGTIKPVGYCMIGKK